jgi:versiconal hemiacetal acetate esterase
MYTIGGSAGGGLALGVARQIALGLTTLPRTSIKGVVALVPQIFHPQHVPEQFKAAYTAYTQNGTDVPMIDKLAVDTTLEMAGIDASNADYLVGMDVKSLKLFPPTYIATCEMDPLRDDGKILATALGEAGVEVKHDHYKGLPHCFWFVPISPETGTFVEKTVRGLEWVIGKM